MTVNPLKLFGCRHSSTTWPQTPRDKDGKREPTYIVCLDCGNEFLYDMENMKITGRRYAA